MVIILSSDSPTSPLTCPARPTSLPIDASQYSFPNSQPVVTLDARDGGQAGINCLHTLPRIRNGIGHILCHLKHLEAQGNPSLSYHSLSSDAFKGLSERQRLYAHYLSRASFYGSLIVLVQTSPEAPHIFRLIHRINTAQVKDSY